MQLAVPLVHRVEHRKAKIILKHLPLITLRLIILPIQLQLILLSQLIQQVQVPLNLLTLQQLLSQLILKHNLLLNLQLQKVKPPHPLLLQLNKPLLQLKIRPLAQLLLNNLLLQLQLVVKPTKLILLQLLKIKPLLLQESQSQPK